MTFLIIVFYAISVVLEKFGYFHRFLIRKNTKLRKIQFFYSWFLSYIRHEEFFFEFWNSYSRTPCICRTVTIFIIESRRSMPGAEISTHALRSVSFFRSSRSKSHPTRFYYLRLIKLRLFPRSSDIDISWYEWKDTNFRKYEWW